MRQTLIVSMDKEHILAEIRRTARENGNRPLGVQRFTAETGIREFDWHGKLWARWGDALREAGFEANTLVEATKVTFSSKSTSS
jgi:hypothetical protein